MKPEKWQKVTKYVISSTMLAGAAAGPSAVFAAKDAPEPSAVQAAVKELLSQGIISGDASGNLNLEGNLTRMQAASILARALKLELRQTARSAFTDVSSDSWGLKYIDALARLGIMVGADGKFRPNDALTKEELAVLLVRITQADITGKGANIPVKDAGSISDYAKPFVHAAIELGLLPVKNGLFEPSKKVTREEVVLATNTFVNSSKFEAYQGKVKTLYDQGKKVSNSDPSVA